MAATRPTYRERVRGCLLGGAVGDALGAGIEFESLASIRAAHGPAGVTGPTPTAWGEMPITDDTQMTLFTAEGLIRSSVRMRTKGIGHVPSVVWRAYRRWLATQEEAGPPDRPNGWLASQSVLYARRAPGTACLSGLRREEMGRPDDPANPDSKGCGTVMRSAPFGLVPAGGRDQAWELAVECAVLTHGHPTGYLAAGGLALMVHEIVGGAGIADAARSVLDRLAGEPDGAEVVSALRAALDAAAADGTDGGGGPSAERVESLGAGWVAEEALAIAVYCAAAAPADPRRALLAAVNHSGDSDSTGAVCGNLVGTALGDLALPWEWLAAVEARDLVSQVADDFVREMSAREQITDDWGGATPGWFARYPGG